LRALGNPKGVDAYYSKWRERFALCRTSIDAACAALPSVHLYSIDPDVAPEDIAGLASKLWFKERVFDIYLWEFGDNTSSRPAASSPRPLGDIGELC
jgi:hypothetical protein